MKMDINSQIIDQGKNFGACLVGIANFESLLNSPSRTLFGKLDRQKIVGLKNSGKAIPEDIGWPFFVKSIYRHDRFQSMQRVRHALQNRLPSVGFSKKDLSWKKVWA